MGVGTLGGFGDSQWGKVRVVNEISYAPHVTLGVIDTIIVDSNPFEKADILNRLFDKFVGKKYSCWVVADLDKNVLTPKSELIELIETLMGLKKCIKESCKQALRIMEEMSDYEKSLNGHEFLTEKDNPSKHICDRNGEVVLSQCKVCGQAERELEPKCPGK